MTDTDTIQAVLDDGRMGAAWTATVTRDWAG